MRETEVRFSVNEKNKAKAERWFSGHESKVQKSESLYLDTPSNHLRKAGCELRLRRNESGIKQTIKSTGPKGSLFTRNESEIALNDFQPNLEHLRKFMKDQRLGRLNTDTIAPAFRTHVTRRAVLIPTNSGAVESVLDIGAIETENQSQQLFEVEHELKEGAPKALIKTCHDFLDRVPCSIGLEGKAARGYRLLTGKQPKPVFASKFNVPAETTLPDAIKKILQSSFQHAMANLPVYVQTGEMEAVHQFRVGIRRFRAALSAFSPIINIHPARKLKSDILSVFDALGDIRNADVFLEETLPEISATTAKYDFLNPLRSQVSLYRKNNFEEVRCFLLSNDFARLVVDTNAWIDSQDWLRHDRPVDQLMSSRPIGEFAQRRLSKMTGKLLKLGGVAEHGNLEDWHRLRIMTKKVRYSSEPLIRITGSEEGLGFAKELSKLQDTLGKLNDLNSIELFLTDVAKTVRERDMNTFRERSAFCVGWGASRAERAVSDLQPSWQKFRNNVTPMWK